MVATIRVRNFHAAKDVLESCGIEPAAVLKSVGLDGNLFSNRDNVVLYADAARFLAECARLTQCEDFGLHVGMRQDAAAMGLVGLVSLSAMRVGEALDIIATGLRTTDSGGVFCYESRGGSLYMSYVVTESFGLGEEYLKDGALAVGCNFMRQFCGAEWRPDRVTLTRAAPPDASRYRQFFRATVEFGAAAPSLVCDASVLNRQVATHNPHHMEILSPLLSAALSETGKGLLSTVKAVIRAQVSGGRLTRARVAQAMGLTEHMLVHRLGEAELSFSALAEEVKYDMARHMLAGGRDLRAVAGELGFADASAFSRAFVKWSGRTPGRWRADHGVSRLAARS